MTFDPKTATVVFDPKPRSVGQIVRAAREKAESGIPPERTVHDVVVAARLAARNDPSAAVAVAEPPVAEAVVEPVAEPTAEVVAEVVAEVKETAKPEPQATFKAVSVDDHGVIIGIGAVSGNVDLDNDIVEHAALLNLAYSFCAGNRTFKANHKTEIGCDLVASWPGAPILKSGKTLAFGEETPDNDPIVGISLEKGTESHWFVAVKPHDPKMLKAAKAGDITGFSWAGMAERNA